MIRVVVIGDSLSLPRNVDVIEPIFWDDCWPNLIPQELRSALPIEVLNLSGRSKQIESLVNEFTDFVELTNPDVIIVQLGIVDAAPRIFSKTEKTLLQLSLVPSRFRQLLINKRKRSRDKIISKNPLRKVYTSPTQFRYYLKRFNEIIDNHNSKNDKHPIVLFIPIVGCIQMLNNKSPGYSSNIQLYNSILMSFCSKGSFEFLSLPEIFSLNKENFANDGYHLSKRGNANLAKILSNQMVKRLKHVN